MSGSLHPEAARLIKVLELAPHSEGGWFRETWRGPGRVPVDELTVAPTDAGTGHRSPGTAIYYLLVGDEVSHLHRLHRDEVWHFYAGSGLDLHLFPEDGIYRRLELGPPGTDGRQFQVVVPARCPFGATVDHSGGYALVGCTMAPGFAVEDFELLDRDFLRDRFPDHNDLVYRLTFDRT